MNNKELKLVSELLKYASEALSRHVCNDMDEGYFKDWTDEEKLELAKNIEDWNGTPDDLDEEMDGSTYPDWLVMGYYADKILGNK